MRLVVPLTEEDANLMEALGISVTINLAACWLKLGVYEAAQHHCDLALKTRPMIRRFFHKLTNIAISTSTNASTNHDLKDNNFQYFHPPSMSWITV